MVNIPIKAGTGNKDVPIKIESKNGDASQFDITADINSLKLSGDAEKLAKISNVTATVDLSNVTQTSQQTVDLVIPDGITADHETVQITIEPKQ
ncbi:YbbR-like domain-containing protein [Weissella coleopterorum]|uniref:YbbR-like domain-containing protein n=1 Tax=Weissella coleopterorum TaxID=2714949 RepID=UPI0031B634F9